jgi:hypothetical protein
VADADASVAKVATAVIAAALAPKASKVAARSEQVLALNLARPAPPRASQRRPPPRTPFFFSVSFRLSALSS